MAIKGQAARVFFRAIKRAGERFDVIADGRHYVTRAVVQNSGKNFMRKYDNDGVNIGKLGLSRPRDKVAFLPYLPAWDTAENIGILWRGKSYIVLADNVVMLDDEPYYIWALIAEKSKAKEGYYDDTE